MNTLLMETAITKLDDYFQNLQAQDKRLTAIESKIASLPDHSESLQALRSEMVNLRSEVKAATFPAKDLQVFVSLLRQGVAQLRQPVETKTIHHHTIPGLLWVTAGLFCLLCCVTCGWINTGEKLAIYRGNDVKYRQLSLTPGHSKATDFWDSLYELHPDSLQHDVEEKERLIKRKVELQMELDEINGNKKINNMK